MRTTSVLVAALVAAASVAGHETAERRRIYFPRHIKRQFSNATVSSQSPSPSSEDSTKRESSLADLIDSLTDLPFPSVAAAVTTVVIQSTVYVPPIPTPGKNNGIGGNSTNPDPALTSDAPFSSQPSASAKPSEPPVNPISKPPTSELDSSAPVSLAPTTPSSSSGIVIAPTGVVSESTTPTPTPTPTPAESTTKNQLDPVTSLLSEVVSVITSVLPPLQNATETKIPDEPLPTSSLITIPDTTPPGTGIVSSTTEPQPKPSETEPTDSPTVEPTPPPVSSTTIVPPPVSNTTEPPPPPSSTPPPVSKTSESQVTPPPSSFTSVPPPPITNSTSNSTAPEPTPTPTDPSGVTEIPQLGSTTNSESWLPTTILVDPTSTTVSGGLAPTTATGIPSAYPKAITPADSGDKPQPPDTTLIQIGLLEGYNYPFVVANNKAAAQIFQLLPDALGYAVGEDLSKIQMRKLIPLDTGASMGFITTLAIVSFPNHLVEELRVYVKAPNSPLYNNPDQLTYNFTKQINPAIDITIGSYEADVGGGGSPGSPGGGGTQSGDGPFTNPDGSDPPRTAAQTGTTAAIIGTSVFVAAAYGAVMFVIARRYKKKKQAHRRASSISNNSSDMRQTPSPALMGGALLSRDFTGYGGVTAGTAGSGVAGGRDSHGSGRSGMNNSARTQYISAPVAAENSLGWN